MKLVIAGSRSMNFGSYQERLGLYQLWSLFRIQKPTTILHGGCPTGTDAWAENAAHAHHIPTEVFKADWEEYGLAAGPIRNQQMAEAGDALLLVWDGNSRWSADMRRKMIATGKPVYEVILRKVQ